MNSKLRQIYYDLRHQPVIAWVTFLATAMTIFLFVIVSMMDNVKRVPFAPESCRQQLLVGPTLHITADSLSGSEDTYNASGMMSFKTARRLYRDLQGIEHMSIASVTGSGCQVNLPGQKGESETVRPTDAEFFKIFDHKLLQGRYYTPQEAESNVAVAVITESVARRLFGDTNPIGADCLVDYMPYRVIGVIADHSQFATQAAGDVFIPAGPQFTANDWADYLGDFGAYMTLKPGVTRADIQRQVEQRYAELTAELAADKLRAVYHEAPYDVEIFADGKHLYSNGVPEGGKTKAETYFIYTILLLVPAINLSAMLQSRMRRRISEIGVRRAYGCTRSRIFIDIIVENMFITLAGALVGLVLAVIVGMTYGHLFDGMDIPIGSTPPLTALLSWPTIVVALTASVLLNLLTASVPALRAACIKPVEAINATK